LNLNQGKTSSNSRLAEYRSKAIGTNKEGMVIGNDLYEILSSFSSPLFSDDYYFKRIGEYLVDRLKQSYLLHSVVSMYENENITIQQQQQQRWLEKSQLPLLKKKRPNM
jgi:hypothetical protein